MELRNSVTDQRVALGLVIASWFLAPNYNSNVGYFYAIGALLYLTVYISKQLPQLPIFGKRGFDIAGQLVIVSFAGLLWIIGSSFVVTGGSNLFAVKQVFSLYSSIAPIPILVGVQGINEFVYGLHTPWVETLGFFGGVLPFVADILKVPIVWNLGNPKMWWVIGIMAALFALFHLTAHFPTNSTLTLAEKIGRLNVALFTDFAFAFVSAALVFKYGYLLPAAIFHELVNLLVLA